MTAVWDAPTIDSVQDRRPVRAEIVQYEKSCAKPRGTQLMKFGLIFSPPTPVGGRSDAQILGEWVEEVVYAEELGFDSIWMTEHHFSRRGTSPGGESFPALAAMAAYASARTKRIRIGTGVCVLPWNHPVRAAEDFATVDVLSGGRLEFGVGRGNEAIEFAGLGVPMEKTQERFDEELEIILKAWTEEFFTHKGTFYEFNDINVIPKPMQKPHPPIWQPVISPETMLKVARRGIQPLLGGLFVNQEITKEIVFGSWFAAVDEAGRKREDFECLYQDWCYVADTRQQAKREAEEAFMWFIRLAGANWGPANPTATEQYKIYAGMRDRLTNATWDEIYENVYVGEPAKVIEKIKWLEEECGINQFVVHMGFGSVIEVEKTMRCMELFANKVMPAFSRDNAPTKVLPVNTRA